MDLWLMRGASAHIHISSSNRLSKFPGPASLLPTPTLNRFDSRPTRLRLPRLGWVSTNQLRSVVMSCEVAFGRYHSIGKEHQTRNRVTWIGTQGSRWFLCLFFLLLEFPTIILRFSSGYCLCSTKAAKGGKSELKSDS